MKRVFILLTIVVNRHVFVHGPEAIELDGRSGSRYWIYKYTEFFPKQKPLNDRLSGFPFAIFPGAGRHPSQCPIVFLVQGIGSSYKWNSFLVPTLTDMGITVYMFDFPFTGERTLVELSTHVPQPELFETTCSMLGKGSDLGDNFVRTLVQRMYEDVFFMRSIGIQYYGFTSDKIAFIGTSTGVLLSGLLFTRYKIGERLYGITGHLDLPKFCQTYMNLLFPGLGTTHINHVEDWLLMEHSEWPHDGALSLLKLLRQLMEPASEICREIDPLTYIPIDGCSGKRVRLLVGKDDNTCELNESIKCSKRFVDGDCYSVPGLYYPGPNAKPNDQFIHHVRFFIGTQLGDWALGSNAYLRELVDPFSNGLTEFSKSKEKWYSVGEYQQKEDEAAEEKKRANSAESNDTGAVSSSDATSVLSSASSPSLMSNPDTSYLSPRPLEEDSKGSYSSLNTSNDDNASTHSAGRVNSPEQANINSNSNTQQPSPPHQQSQQQQLPPPVMQSNTYNPMPTNQLTSDYAAYQYGPQNMYSYYRPQPVSSPSKPKPDISQLARVIAVCHKCGKPIACAQCSSPSPYGCH